MDSENVIEFKNYPYSMRIACNDNDWGGDRHGYLHSGSPVSWRTFACNAT